MAPKILVATSSPTRGKAYLRALRSTELQTDLMVNEKQPPSPWSEYRLLVCDGSPGDLLERLPAAAHVILLVRQLPVADLVDLLGDPRVNHVLARPYDAEQLWHVRHVALKLATGDIFGFKRYLPAEWDASYRRIETHDERGRALVRLDEFCDHAGFSADTRSQCKRMVDALLHNAMYDAPVDEQGQPLFGRGESEPAARQPSPRKVSLRYAAYGDRIFVSIRDRYGSLTREKLIDGLQRGLAGGGQTPGANHGLHLAATLSSWMMVNTVARSVSEIVCVTDGTVGGSGLRLFSFAAHPEPVEDEEPDDDAGELEHMAPLW